MASRTDSAPQLDFGFRTPPRKRKPKRGRPHKPGAGVSHQRRAVHPRHPLHVTLRMQPHVWQLRSRRCYRVLHRAFLAGCDRFGARIAHFSVQHNHVHLVVEAEDSTALARAMQGLTIRMAKGLNKLMRRAGRVFGDRYHARSLRTPTEVRAALVYVYGNARKHLARFGTRFSATWVDEYSSAQWFDGWLDAPGGEPPAPCPVASSTVWLLTRGWRERGGGPLRPDETPSLPDWPRPALHRGAVSSAARTRVVTPWSAAGRRR